MIPFNVPPCVGSEEKYIAEAISNHKLCGDGEFTKKCNAKLEEMTGVKGASDHLLYTRDRDGCDFVGY